MSVRLGLLLGDPCGIGPELVAKLLASGELEHEVATVVIGEPRILARGQELAGTATPVPQIARLDQLEGAGPALLPGAPIDPDNASLGEVSAVADKAVLDTFRTALRLAQTGELDAICFAPRNKQAMHQGGIEFEDEFRFFVHVLGYDGFFGEANVTDQLATTRVTSHVPLRAVADLVTGERVLQAIRDGGLFGREEIEVIAPAVERARRADRRSGPYPSDTVFLRARDGAFDAVVTMYHDQGRSR